MGPDLETLLRPLDGEAGPCGPDLRELADFEAVREVLAEVDRAGSAERVGWARELERIARLAAAGRDLRVWVWLCRGWAAGDGLEGLARGLELIAAGLERFWDTLPPYDEEESDPRERFMARLGALAALGATSYQLGAEDLRNRRSTTHLQDELDLLVGRATPGEATAALGARAEAALARIERLFKERFGDGRDPQLDFPILVGKLALLRPPPATAANGGTGERRPGAGPVGNGSAAPGVAAASAGPVATREDVVRTLNLVLDYYAANEPASPVPLLVARAKRLVPMSFLEAIKELAPAGLKELQAVAGGGEDSKQQQQKKQQE